VTLVGVLGEPLRATVDEVGRIACDGVGWRLDWWIGADDRWRVPARETAVRQELVEDMPVVRTAMRVPGGDALHSVYGAAGEQAAIVVEITNDSPAPFVAAFVVSGARAVALAERTAVVDGRSGLIAARAPSRWAVGRSIDVEVCSGAARTGAFPPTRDRAARIEAAFLHPVAHRTSLRVAIVPKLADPDAVDLAALPSPADAARGWGAQLDRGMRVDLPGGHLPGAVLAARAQTVLGAGRHGVASSDVAALEDWGLDAEALDGWKRLSGRERRRAKHRRVEPATWADVCAAEARGGSDLLLALRSLLVHESAGSEVTVLAELPEEWRGHGVEVHDAPTLHGPVSYAVRWHGPRPALLWDAPAGVTLRAPGLDPAWETSEPTGEALLATGSAA